MLRLKTILTIQTVWHHWLLITEALALLNIFLLAQYDADFGRLAAGLQETHYRSPTYAVNPTAVHFSIKTACFRNMAPAGVSWRKH